MQFSYGTFRLIDRGHHDKTKSFGFLVIFVGDDFRVFNCPDSAEELKQVALGRVEIGAEAQARIGLKLEPVDLAEAVEEEAAAAEFAVDADIGDIGVERTRLVDRGFRSGELHRAARAGHRRVRHGRHANGGPVR